MKLTITGYSTALFSTWYFIEELGLLFDAGDGITSGILQKSRKIKHVFISHADRDHLTGLLQLNQLNARDGFPVIYYPEDCGSFGALEDFSKKFDTHVSFTKWEKVSANQKIQIKDNLIVEAFENNHVKAKQNYTKSLSFKVVQTKQKLKSEYSPLKGSEIKNLIKKLGKNEVTYEVRSTLLGYSGDTPIEDYERWDNTKILIHEATFLEDKNQREINPKGNYHSTLDEVIRMVSEINVETLILGHFSSRYSGMQIDENIKKLCKIYNVKIPVFRVLPGEISRNIINKNPING